MRYELYSFPDNNIFGINTVGYSDDMLVTRFGPGKRNNHIIHYVISGQGFFNNHPVYSGQGFLITPGMSEQYFPDSNNPWEFIWIIFDNSPIADRIFKEYNADPQTSIFEYSNTSLLIQSKNMIKENNNKIYSSPELYEIFLHIFNNHNITYSNKKDCETIYYNYAVKFINANVFRKIQVNEIVKMLGISQPYLYNIFMKKASVSPKKYIDFVKLEKAKGLLLETSMQLTEIANSIGIEDCITFSKFFKKNIGMSPTNFRKISEKKPCQ